MLYEAGLIPALAKWLKSKQATILVPVIRCLSSLVCGNEVIANRLLQCKFCYVLHRAGNNDEKPL